MNQICSAIAARQIVEFDYDGHHRVVQPAAAGHHVTTGNAVLRGYQIGGTSGSGTVPQWRLFRVAQIQNLVVTGQTIATNPPLYVRGDSDINVLCEL